jgi:uncharacterized protein YjaZ
VLIIPVGYTAVFSFFAYQTLRIPKSAAITSKKILKEVAFLYGSRKKSMS